MKRCALLPVIGLLLAACAGPPAGDAQPGSTGGGGQEDRALMMAIRYEPSDLSPKMTAESGGFTWKVPFNAFLARINANGYPQPYLAEALPELNTDSWRVSPDGRMETVHRLRPNLTWHDGHPLTAEDFVFAWRVYRTPELGVFSSDPQNLMDEVIASDPVTLLIRWNSLYYDASTLIDSRDGSLEPLPRHLLEEQFADVLQDPSAQGRFLSLSYWTSDYIGAGPYRLNSWEHGVQLEGVAFHDHALGRPKISRLIMQILPDENTVLSNVLAGTIDIATRFSLRFEHAMVLKRDWEANGRGVVVMGEGDTAPVSIQFQFRPEFLQTPELLDLRVRKALAHGMDQTGVVQGLYDGVGETPDSFVPRNEPFFAELDRSITKYPYDPRRAEQYLQEAGLTKGSDGRFVNRGGETFGFDYRSTENLLTQRAMTIVVEMYQQLGVDAQLSVLPAAMNRDREVRHTFPGIATAGTSNAIHYVSDEIGKPVNRWAGQNRSGWANTEYDRLWDVYNTTLDRTERNSYLIGLAKLVSENVPGLFVYYANNPTFAHISTLRGPDPGVSGTENFWNIHEWERR